MIRRHLTRRRWLEMTAGTAGTVLLNRAAAGNAAPEGMVPVPAGSFLMGTDPEEAELLAARYGHHPSWLSGETPRRRIDLPVFWIDRHPVTNADYARFISATGRRPPPHWNGNQPPDRLLSHPVTLVDHAEATAYARWLGKRLPTEAEWEKAARGTDGRQYPWGNAFDPEACHFDRGGTPVDTPSAVPHHLQEEVGRATRGAPAGTCPVGAHPRGASPYGVLDLIGNVAEWCADSPGPGSAIVKGGCWLTTSPLNLRAAVRILSGFANNKLAFLGFRCVQEVRG